jgi:membrane-associated phospholipid phosphatase
MLDPHQTPNLTPTRQQRLTLMALNGVLFQALYSACNFAAARAGVTRHIATSWDAAVPFVPWMLVPYMTSVPLLVMAFLFTPTWQSLRALSQRCMLATVVGTLIFALWPLHIAIVRPASSNAVLSALGDLLQRLDAPYNQWPSLHVAYCMLVWVALRDRIASRPARIALAAWLMLVAASTVLTHQHYLPDFAGGVLLGATALWVVPARRDVPWVSLHYAVAATAALVLGMTVFPLLPCVWLAACCAAVACAYAREDADFLHKRDGGFPLWVWMLYGPYLLGYRVTWWCVRWHERGQPSFVKFDECLWVGRRLTDAEAKGLPANCSVIDLAAELSGTRALRGPRNKAFGLLDLMWPSAHRLSGVIDAIDSELRQGRNVYLHCAMGYRRSREVAAAWRARYSTPSPP